MEYMRRKRKNVVEIDLHKMEVCEAKRKLELFVKGAPENTIEIIVIHGYRSGNKLLNMVRNEFKSKRVKRKFLSLNKGITTLILDDKNLTHKGY